MGVGIGVGVVSPDALLAVISLVSEHAGSVCERL
jgi:hypothetical protein